jgi:tetratricopeptide (TPR) repeat protein
MSSSSSLEQTLGGETGGEARERAIELVAGDRVGRHVVVERLGAGGMGVVYAAYDPELDRRIAIKLLRGLVGRESRMRARILREAQALARLAHPNVVAIHDVGMLGDRPWIAMEYVEGETLSAWRARTRPTWREALDVMIAAGRGLAAAHAVGLVHRDFKPDNVMVSATRVRVMDFGLALHASSDDEHESDVDGPPLTGRTRAGSLIGTLGYMPPEQLHRRVVDAKSDQFAFCVTLWEALYGERPFEGETALEESSSVLDGRLRQPPSRHGAPRWLRELVSRGLARDPAQRFASMDVLLEALVRGQSRARRRALAAAAIVAAVIAVAVLARRNAVERAMHEECAREGRAIAELWPGPDDARRTAIAEAMHASGLRIADDTALRTSALLDRYTADWAALRTSMCIADHEAAQTGSPGRACLDEQRDELEALLDALQAGDRASVISAVGAAASLSPARECENPSRDPRISVDPAMRDAERALRAELLRAHSKVLLGRSPEVVDHVPELIAAAEQLDAPALLASAHELHARALYNTDAFEQSAAASHRAFAIALADARDEVAARNASQLVFVLGYRLGRTDEALQWGQVTRALLRRAGLEGSTVDGFVHHFLAIVHTLRGEQSEALIDMRKAIAIASAIDGPDHPSVAQLESDLGGIYFHGKEYRLALEYYARALAGQRAALGPEHPSVVGTLGNLGAAQGMLGDNAAALESFEQSLAIAEAVNGPKHSQVAVDLRNIGQVRMRMNDFAGAAAALNRARTIYEGMPGAFGPYLADVLTNLGEIELEEQRPREAIALFQRALDGEEAPERVQHRLALRGRAEAEAGMGPEASATLERAVAMGDVGVLGEAELYLGEQLVRDDLPRARELVQDARERLRVHDTTGGRALARAERWLAAHGE